jgi:type IV secretory pathway TraG/TraD family ATPase VirD4
MEAVIKICREYMMNHMLLLTGCIAFLSCQTFLSVRKFKTIGFLFSLVVFTVVHFLFFRAAPLPIFLLLVLLPVFVVVFVLLAVFDKSAQKKEDPFFVEILTDKKKKVYLENINTGVAIFGASGAGKSAGPIFWLLKHFAKYEFAGIIYDYKDYELTEIAYPLFKSRQIEFKIFCLHDVNRSVRINPIDPKFMKTEADVNGIISTLVLNLGQSDGDSDASRFFREGTESLMSAVIWRLKTEYPDKCNLPFLVAFLLSADNHHEKIESRGGQILVNPYKKLVDWICKDQRAEILGSVFLTGLSNERQTASLYGTLAAALRKLASPEMFYLLSSNEMDLDINSEGKRTVVSIINSPGKAEASYSPILATVLDSILTNMSERNRPPSFTLVDEAPTIKIMGLARRIATLRSFGLAFVYCVQDKIQSVAQWSGKEYKMKEIFSNLSTIFMGKVNDPDTAKYYQNYFELIKEKQVSVSKGKGDIFSSPDKGGTRVTTSTKDKNKVLAHEFFKLRAGEFVKFSAGEDVKFRFYYEEPEKEIPLPVREVTPTMLDRNYECILNDAKNFLK